MPGFDRNMRLHASCSTTLLPAPRPPASRLPDAETAGPAGAPVSRPRSSRRSAGAARRGATVAATASRAPAVQPADRDSDCERARRRSGAAGHPPDSTRAPRARGGHRRPAGDEPATAARGGAPPQRSGRDRGAGPPGARIRPARRTAVHRHRPPHPGPGRGPVPPAARIERTAGRGLARIQSIWYDKRTVGGGSCSRSTSAGRRFIRLTRGGAVR